MSLTYIHLNRLIKKYDLNVIFLAGPGHGAPALISNVYLEGTYSEIYSDISEDTEGLRRLFKQFSFPAGSAATARRRRRARSMKAGSSATRYRMPTAPRSTIPDLIVAVMVGDGESETGPLATAWHSNKFLNPGRDGAVLPVLHLNGYKIANPTILAPHPARRVRAIVPRLRVRTLLRGGIRSCQHASGDGGDVGALRPAKSGGSSRRRADRFRGQAAALADGDLAQPKGWTGPKEVDGHKVEGFWRAHQVPMAEVHENPTHLALLEEWLRSYRPEELFDEAGRLVPELRRTCPERASVGWAPIRTPTAGCFARRCGCPDFRDYAVDRREAGHHGGRTNRDPGPVPARCHARTTRRNFRVFSPDENASNRLTAIYEVSKKAWLGEYFPEDADGGELAPDGRVMEMLSEHTLEGWLEGYLLTGRHGFFSTYEAFVHVIDSMFNQHAKWLEKSGELSWRADVASLNLLITSTVWRQDHNGFTHQDPGLLGRCRQQEPERDANLSAAGCELPVVGCQSLPAELQLRQCDRCRQAAASSVSRHG